MDIAANGADGSPASLKTSQQISLGNGQSLECVERFCYLGDMIAAGGSSGSLVTLARPSASRLKISDRSSHITAPVLWNSLPPRLRQPATSALVCWLSPAISSWRNSRLIFSITRILRKHLNSAAGYRPPLRPGLPSTCFLR